MTTGRVWEPIMVDFSHSRKAMDAIMALFKLEKAYPEGTGRGRTEQEVITAWREFIEILPDMLDEAEAIGFEAGRLDG